MIAVYSQQEFDDAYDIGKREGYEQAVQEIDMQTGGDGVYRACLGGADPGRHTPDAITMITRIVNRFEILMLLDEATKDGSDQPDDGLEQSPEPIADDSLKAQIGEIGNRSTISGASIRTMRNWQSV